MPSLHRLVYRRLLQRARVFDQHPQLKAVQAFFHDDRREYYVPNPSSAAQTTTAEVVRMLYRHPDGMTVNTALCAMRYMNALIDIARRHKLIPGEGHDNPSEAEAASNTAAPPKHVSHAPNAPLEPGTVLLSHPLLEDKRFHNAVVLICQHDKRGSVGLVINKATLLSVMHTGPASFLGDAKDLLTSWENRRARRFAKQRREIMLDKEPRGSEEASLEGQEEGRAAMQVVVQQAADAEQEVCFRVNDDDDDNDIERVIRRIIRLDNNKHDSDSEADSEDEDHDEGEEVESAADEDGADEDGTDEDGDDEDGDDEDGTDEDGDDEDGDDEDASAQQEPEVVVMRGRSRQRAARLHFRNMERAVASRSGRRRGAVRANAGWFFAHDAGVAASLIDQQAEARGKELPDQHELYTDVLRSLSPLVSLANEANPKLDPEAAFESVLEQLRTKCRHGAKAVLALQMTGSQPLWWGGPAHGGLSMLHTREEAGGSCVVAAEPKTGAPAVYEVQEHADIQKLLHSLYPKDSKNVPERLCPIKDALSDVRVLRGHSRWSGGQLEAEVAQGVWVVAKADAAALGLTGKGVSGQQLWKELLCGMGPLFADMTRISPTVLDDLSDVQVKARVSA